MSGELRDLPSRAAVAHRQRSGTTLIFALAAGWGLFGGLSLSFGRPIIAGIHAVAFVGVIAVALGSSGRPRESEWRAHGGAAFSALALVSVAMVTGQGDSVAWWYLLIVPVFVGQLGGVKVTIAWAAGGAVLVALVFASEFVVHIEPEHLFGSTERSAGGIILTVLALGYTMYVRRLAEQQLSELEDRERTISAQTAELVLARDELGLARDEALSASAAKSRLMARVSHELRTPLNGLLGLSEILAGAPLRPAQLEIARTLRASAVTLKQLVEDLLDVTRIEEGRLSIHPEPTDVRELIGDVLDTFAAIADQRGVELVGLIEPGVPEHLDVDAMRLRQVVANLVSNALKFTGEGEVVVSLEGRVRDRRFAGRLEVRDTGPGVPPDRIEDMFRPFEQLDGPLDLRRQGAGLGLFIAQRLAEALGSKIELASEEGVGSRFSMALEGVCRGSGALGKSGLLVTEVPVIAIEGHPASRAALAQTADFLGAELRPLPTLAAALEAIAVRTPQIVLVDAALADASPSEVAAKIGAAAPRARLVLALRPSSSLVSSSLPAGYGAFTLKPYRASRLRGLLLDIALDSVPDEGHAPTSSAQEPLRCMVVDDDETNRMVARLLLRRANHKVEEAVDAESALALLKGSRPQVIFIDIHMPGQDGLTLARRIRSEFEWGGKPWLIALTAAASEDERQRTQEAGMDDFLEKPIEVGLLRAALERARRGVRRRSRGESGALASVELDLATLQELTTNLGGDAKLVISEYLGSARELAKTLRRASSAGDRVEAHRAAHTLASSSAIVGATAVAGLARALEAGLEGTAKVPAVELDRLDASITIVSGQLSTVVGTVL